MIGFGSPVEIQLDASRFNNDEETRFVAEIVARYAENRRRTAGKRSHQSRMDCLELWAKVAVSRNAWAGGEWLKLRQAIKALNRILRETPV